MFPNQWLLLSQQISNLQNNNSLEEEKAGKKKHIKRNFTEIHDKVGLTPKAHLPKTDVLSGKKKKKQKGKEEIYFLVVCQPGKEIPGKTYRVEQRRQKLLYFKLGLHSHNAIIFRCIHQKYTQTKAEW